MSVPEDTLLRGCGRDTAPSSSQQRAAVPTLVHGVSSVAARYEQLVHKDGSRPLLSVHLLCWRVDVLVSPHSSARPSSSLVGSSSRCLSRLRQALGVSRPLGCSHVWAAA